MTKIHTEEEWQRALDLHKEGMMPRAVARLVGISEREVKHRCRMYDLTGKFQTVPRIGKPVDFKVRCAAVDDVVKKSLSCVLVCAKYDISRSALKDWLNKFRQGGYKNLRDKKPQRSSPRMPKMKKTRAGASELKRLKEENEYLRAEVAYLKKLKALDQEENAEMFGIGPRSSAN